MIYKQYGNTDMQVSAIGMGCMRFDEDDVSSGNLQKCSEVVLYAHEKGINYFDTAPFYSEDKSEEIVGLALSQLKRESFYISSKTNFGTLGNDFSEDSFRKRLDTTLSRLKVDYLDVYHLWCLLSLESYQEQSEALYGFFEKVKGEGLIRNIAFSSHMPGNELEQVIQSNNYKGMLIGYNPLNYRFRQAGLEAAYQKNMGVVVMNPLGGGLIPKNPNYFEYLKNGTDLTVAQASLRFVASHKEVTVALCGFTTKAHIAEACDAVQNLAEKPAMEIVTDHENKGVSLNNLCTGCGYCDHCPSEISIPKYMDSYNQKLLGNDIEERMTGHWKITTQGAATCIQCGLCETLCTQHLPIMSRLKEIASIS